MLLLLTLLLLLLLLLFSVIPTMEIKEVVVVPLVLPLLFVRDQHKLWIITC